MKSTKHILKIFFILAIIQALCFPIISFSGTAEDIKKLNSSIKSSAALVMESETGKVIYEKNGYAKKYPASLTKILTAIIAIENCSLDETAKVSEYAIKSIPSGYTTANIQIGETLSVKDLLYALMLASANEAAVVLGEHISGNYKDFATLMNNKAKEIGCQNSNFVNGNGMHDKNHYTTAYDLALITRYAMKNETFRKIVSTTSYTLPATGIYPDRSRTFSNTNALIIVNKNNVENNFYYPSAIGVKTGYTTPAGNCLVSAANKNDMEFITVTLGGNARDIRYTDSISLLDFAFNNYSFVKLKGKNNSIKTISIENATNDTKNLNLLIDSDIIALANIDNKDQEVEPTINLKENLAAPIKKGEVVGTATYELDGESYTANLLAGHDVEEKTDKIAQITIRVLIVAVVLLLVSRNINKKKI